MENIGENKICLLELIKQGDSYEPSTDKKHHNYCMLNIYCCAIYR
jgi:hypothetical protein